MKTGVQGTYNWWKELDSGFRRNDGKPHFLTFYEFIKLRETKMKRLHHSRLAASKSYPSGQNHPPHPFGHWTVFFCVAVLSFFYLPGVISICISTLSFRTVSIARDAGYDPNQSTSASLMSLANAATPLGAACNAPQLPITGTRILNVSTEAQLQTAINNLQAGDTLLLADGTYNLTSSLYINGKDNVTLRGTSGCDNVVLAGKGMDNANYGNVEFGVWSNAANTTIAHLTIRDTWDNEIILNSGAQSTHIYSVKLLNAGSQFIKANPTDIANGIGVNNGVLEYSWLEYTAGPPAADHGSGTGYTNGISAHAAQNWIIRGNLFKNFHTPDNATYVWNPAVLMWNHSANTLVEQNVFINVDRAVAFGLQTQSSGFDHQGGTIRNNFVYMSPGLFSASRAAGSDGAIIVWDSPNSKVYHNTILTNGNDAKSIEFRFAATTGCEARNNLADAPINLRDGATATQSGNLLTATSSLFVNPASGDLHLLSSATAAIDKAATLSVVTNDFDGNSRPQGAGYDIGADEYVSGTPNNTTPAPPAGLRVQ